MPEQIPLTPKQKWLRAYYETSIARQNKINAYDAINKDSLANTDRKRAEHKAWREANKEKQRAWYRANKDKVKAWREANPELILNKSAKKRGMTGTLSKGLIYKLLESQQWECVYCHEDLHLKYHVDHIVPTSKGGKNVDSNIQILCPKCNRQKSDNRWPSPKQSALVAL